MIVISAELSFQRPMSQLIQTAGRSGMFQLDYGFLFALVTLQNAKQTTSVYLLLCIIFVHMPL